MTLFFGRKGSNTPIPASYDQSILLTTYLDMVEIAWGKYTTNGFLLLKGSWVKKSVHERNNPGVNTIKNELLQVKLLLANPHNNNYYILKEDIIVPSPSTAARLVHATDRSGLEDWKHLGMKLKELLKKDNINSLLNTVIRDLDSFSKENEDLNLILAEGKKTSRFSTYYERDPKLRTAAIKIHGTKCMVPNCSFDFEKAYGKRGKDFIEVHHVKPLSIEKSEHLTDPRNDMVVVCSNCHRIIHREHNHVLSIDEVGELISQNNT